MNVLIWLLSSCVLILAVLLIRALFGRKLRPGLRYALWALVLVRLLVPGSFWTSPVSVEAPISHTELGQDLDLLRQVDTVTRSPEGDVSGVTVRPVPGRGREEQPVVIAQDVTPERFERLRSTLDLRNLAQNIWVTGSVAMAVLFVMMNGLFYVNLWRRRRRLELDCPARVYEVEGLESSCYFLGSIYIDPEAAEDDRALRHVLAHELSHRRHLDGLWALLRCAALSVHWFNPLVWLAASKARQDSELFADAGALKTLGDAERESYGGTLIGLSAHAPRSVSPLSAATTMAGGKKALRQRVELIARKPKATLAVLLAVVFIAGIAVGCTFAGAAYDGVDGEVDDPSQPSAPAGTEPSVPVTEPSVPASEPSGAPETPDLTAYESEVLGISVLYPTDWAKTVTVSDGILRGGIVPGLSEFVPCVRVDLREDIFGVPPYDTSDMNAVFDNAVAFLYWRPAGVSGPEAEYGESVTLYTAEDGSELRCFLPMNTKLNWYGGDVPDGERIFNAYDAVEKSILSGELGAMPVGSPVRVHSLALQDLFRLSMTSDGVRTPALMEITSRLLDSPASVLSALTAETEDTWRTVAQGIGAGLAAWFPEDAGTALDSLDRGTLSDGERAVLDAIVTALEAEQIRNMVMDYLTNLSTESLLYTEQDLRTNTVLDERCGVSSLPKGAKTSFALPSGAQTVAQMRKNITFYEDKAEFWRLYRQIQDIYREDLKLGYLFDEITVNADTARVQVDVTMDYMYTDSTIPTYEDTTYTVDLVKIGGEWWIADINEAYDWFDARFKNTDFDVQAELDSLRTPSETN